MIYNITCEICGKEFEVNCSEYKFNIGKYKHTCSSECAHKLTNKHVDYDHRNKLISSSLKQYNKENPRFKQDKSLKIYTCKYCGKQYYRNEGISEKYCCITCKRKWLNENSPGNCGGYREGSGRGKSGWYKGIHCDSSWELAYLMYHLDNNIKIERCKKSYEYNYNNEIHKYYPDFIVNNTLIEIKGYKTPQWEEKKKIAEILNIKVLYKEDIQYYLDYVKEKYGINFIEYYDNSKPVKSIFEYKKIWVNNGCKNALIDPILYNEYLNNGYVRGRKK